MLKNCVLLSRIQAESEPCAQIAYKLHILLSLQYCGTLFQTIVNSYIRAWISSLQFQPPSWFIMIHYTWADIVQISEGDSHLMVWVGGIETPAVQTKTTSRIGRANNHNQGPYWRPPTAPTINSSTALICLVLLHILSFFVLQSDHASSLWTGLIAACSCGRDWQWQEIFLDKNGVHSTVPWM